MSVGTQEPAHTHFEHGAIQSRPLFDAPIVRRAIVDSLKKLDPRTLIKNPVIFVVEIVSVAVTIRVITDIVSDGPVAFDTAIAVGLWFTVLFANFAEAMAEGRGKAQADDAAPDQEGPDRPAAAHRRHARRPCLRPSCTRATS